MDNKTKSELTYYVKYDGLTSEHTLDLYLLGESLQGVAMLFASSATFVQNRTYVGKKSTQIFKVNAHAIEPNCITLKIFLDFVEQYQLLSGSFGVFLGTVLTYIFSKRKSNIEEMKLLKDSLDKAINHLATKDNDIKGKLIELIDKLADKLAPQVDKAIAPIGNGCESVSFLNSSKEVISRYDTNYKNSLPQEETITVLEMRSYKVRLRELDLDNKTAKVVFCDNREDDSKRIKAVISDPSFEIIPNIYSTAFDTNTALTCMAKASVNADGEIIKLTVFDAQEK